MGGGGGVDRALWLDRPPKRAQLTEPSKTNLGTFVVRMAVVFVFESELELELELEVRIELEEADASIAALERT